MYPRLVIQSTARLFDFILTRFCNLEIPLDTTDSKTRAHCAFPFKVFLPIYKPLLVYLCPGGIYQIHSDEQRGI